MVYVAKKKPLSAEQQAALLAACSSDDDKLLVTLLVSCGLRLPEYVGIRPKHFDGKTLRVGTRSVNLTRAAKSLLSKRLSGHKTMPLKERGAEKRLAAIASRAGIEDVTPDVLRRTYIAEAVRKGVQPHVVREQIGASIDSITKMYMMYAPVS